MVDDDDGGGGGGEGDGRVRFCYCFVFACVMHGRTTRFPGHGHCLPSISCFVLGIVVRTTIAGTPWGVLGFTRLPPLSSIPETPITKRTTLSYVAPILCACACAVSTGGAPRDSREGRGLGRERRPVSRDVQLDRRPRRRVRPPEHGDGRRCGGGQQTGKSINRPGDRGSDICAVALPRPAAAAPVALLLPSRF